MLTKQKLGAIFCTAVVLIAISFVFAPSKAKSATTATIGNNSFNVTDTNHWGVKDIGVSLIPWKYNDFTGQNGQHLISTDETLLSSLAGIKPSVNSYYIKDDNMIAIYDVKNGVSTLQTVITPTREYTPTKPILSSDINTLKTSLNGIADQEGFTKTNPNYDAFQSLQTVDSRQTPQRELNNKVTDLQNQIDQIEANKVGITDPSTLDNLNQSITNLKSQIATAQAQHAAGNTALTNQASNLYGPQGKSGDIYCLRWGAPMLDLGGCAAIASQWLLKGASWVLWASAIIFDFSLTYSLNFKDLLKEIPIVDIGWGIFRDISNIFFIFILLAAAIGIILDNSKIGSKQMVGKVIMTAILINFSLFFTEVIIDASNIVTLQFYNQIVASGSSGGASNGSSANATGISEAFMNGLKLESIYSLGTPTNPNTAGNTANTTAITQAGGSSATLNNWNITIVGLGGTVLVLVAAFVFFAGTILFLYRSVILVILITISPLAFLAQALPNGSLGSGAGKWWNTLVSQAMFPPVYMVMTYIVVKAINAQSAGAQGGFAAFLTGTDVKGSIGLTIHFLIIIGFMIVDLGSVAAPRALVLAISPAGARVSRLKMETRAGVPSLTAPRGT